MRKYYLFTIICFLILFDLQSQEWEWARKANSSTAEQSGKKICSDNRGNFYVYGTSSGTSVFNSTTLPAGNFLLKYDSLGGFLWGQLIDEITDFNADGSGNLYLLSNLANNTYLRKLNSSGATIWTKTIIGTPYVKCQSIVSDSIGNIYLTGIFHDSLTIDGNMIVDTITMNSFYLAKLNSSGVSQWLSRGLSDNITGNYYIGNHLQLHKNGNIYLIAEGISGGACSICGGDFLVKYTTSGNLISSIKKWDMYEDISSFVIDDSCNVFAIFNCGNAHGMCSKLVKYDSSMNTKWGKRMDPWVMEHYSLINGLSVDAAGNCYVAGNALTTTNQYDIQVAKLDPSGNYVWKKNAGGQIQDAASDMFVTRSGTCYVTGTFNNTYDSVHNSEAGFDNDTLVNDGNWMQLFVAKLKPTNLPLGVPLRSERENITLYPNPTSGIFHINYSSLGKGSLHINVFDSRGQNVYRNDLLIIQGDLYQEIDLSNKSKGIYLVEILSDRSRMNKKIIVE